MEQPSMRHPGGKPDMADLINQLHGLRDLLVEAAQLLRDAQAHFDIEGEQQARAALEQLLQKLAPP
jgi:hypothetical protein